MILDSKYSYDLGLFLVTPTLSQFSAITLNTLFYLRGYTQTGYSLSRPPGQGVL